MHDIIIQQSAVVVSNDTATHTAVSPKQSRKFEKLNVAIEGGLPLSNARVLSVSVVATAVVLVLRPLLFCVGVTYTNHSNKVSYLSTAVLVVLRSFFSVFSFSSLTFQSKNMTYDSR